MDAETMRSHGARAAPVWKRILAFLLDLYLALAVTSALVVLVAPRSDLSLASALSDPAGIVTPLAAAAFAYLALLVLLYHVACEYLLGQTPGMLLFNLRVRTTRPPVKRGAAARSDARTSTAPSDADGAGLTFSQALVRNLFLLPLFPFYLFWLVEPLFYVFQGERLLEHWTRTETVEGDRHR